MSTKSLQQENPSMNKQSTFQRTLQALLISGISVFAVLPSHAAEPARVTADNYVRAESDFQMKGYIEKLDNFGKFYHNREPYDQPFQGANELK
jgi:hypothetical protein